VYKPKVADSAGCNVLWIIDIVCKLLRALTVLWSRQFVSAAMLHAGGEDRLPAEGEKGTPHSVLFPVFLCTSTTNDNPSHYGSTALDPTPTSKQKIGRGIRYHSLGFDRDSKLALGGILVKVNREARMDSLLNIIAILRG